jgi:hypothetical protein
MTEYIDVDVRPILRAGGEPFSVIMSALESRLRCSKCAKANRRPAASAAWSSESWCGRPSPRRLRRRRSQSRRGSNAAAIDGKRLVQSNPIQSGPGVDPRPALVEVKLEPIAVVLDFVEPVVAGGRLGSQRGELGGMNPGIADGFEPVDRSREKPRLGTLRQLRKLAKFRPGPEDNGGQSPGYFPKAANGQTRT